MLLVPVRQYLLPRVIRPEYLAELDAQTDQLVEALEHQRALEEAVLVGLEPPVPKDQPSSEEEEWELELHGSGHLRAAGDPAPPSPISRAGGWSGARKCGPRQPAWRRAHRKADRCSRRRVRGCGKLLSTPHCTASFWKAEACRHPPRHPCIDITLVGQQNSLFRVFFPRSFSYVFWICDSSSFFV